MKDILSYRGLSALGWLSAFGYLWAFALGVVPGGWTAIAVYGISLVVALAAGKAVAQRERAEAAEAAKWEAAHPNRKANPPAWTDNVSRPIIRRGETAQNWPDYPEPQEEGSKR